MRERRGGRLGAALGMHRPPDGLHGVAVPRQEARRAPAAGDAGRAERVPRHTRQSRHGEGAPRGRGHGRTLLPEPPPPPPLLHVFDTALAIRRPKTFSRSPRHAEPLLRAAQHAAPPQKSRATLTTLALPHRVQLMRSPPACRRHQPLPGEGGIRVVPEKMESRAESDLSGVASSRRSGRRWGQACYSPPWRRWAPPSQAQCKTLPARDHALPHRHAHLRGLPPPARIHARPAG
ncbi:unnamed protein product [Miscanthus lutarioriparius]|uniref:Uncharacterized protein n=1 Tax=Miscanthus lutarioriparius TaxID=422564 RepID=A0A811MP03_9POAL|nr:unnamed protein product [Miscanthus lutarioriparius]